DVAFGPLAGASTALDLAFRDVTGESMAHNAIAAVFGPSETPMDAEPSADLASFTTAAGRRVQLADGGHVRRGSHQ
ncbi:MAG TPA: hypothetical protein VJ790_13535, partial [Dongiaceae bacterium]|nr:hypothetical protein [Dongiaceae bacterium]